MAVNLLSRVVILGILVRLLILLGLVNILMSIWARPSLVRLCLIGLRFLLFVVSWVVRVSLVMIVSAVGLSIFELVSLRVMVECRNSRMLSVFDVVLTWWRR